MWHKIRITFFDLCLPAVKKLFPILAKKTKKNYLNLNGFVVGDRVAAYSNWLNMIRFFYFIVFLVSSQLFSQNKISVDCRGKVNADMTNLEGIYVINLKTENASITDSEGYFSIKGTVGDTLLLSSVQFKSIKKVLTPVDVQSSLFFVQMKPIMNELREVIVKRSTVSAESLGIIT